MHEQRGFDARRIGLDQGFEFGLQLGEQAFGVGRAAAHDPDLPLGVRRLGERAQVQTDHRAFEPGPRLGKGERFVVGGSAHGGSAMRRKLAKRGRPEGVRSR